MLDFFEFEEQAGKLWHRLVGEPASLPRWPEAAATLDSLRRPLSVYYRGLGGLPGLRLAAGAAGASGHRLKLRQRLGMDAERMDRARATDETLFLPAVLDCLPDVELNRRLYFWLGAYFAIAGEAPTPGAIDPLQRDLAFLRFARQTSERTRARCPGLADTHDALRAGLLDVRPVRNLPAAEAAVEEVVSALLGGPAPASSIGQAMLAAVTGDDAELGAFNTARTYRPFLPCALWGEVESHPRRGSSERIDDDEAEGGSKDARDGRNRKARRRRHDQAKRNDPLLLNRFEKILSWGEMINLNRAIDDEDEDAARKAADDLDEITLDSHERKAAIRLKFDLDLAPDEVEAARVNAPLTYPEWDYRQSDYHPDHCAVFTRIVNAEKADWVPDAATRRAIRRVRRQFEAMRSRRELLRRQLDGDELDMNAVIRARCDEAANGRIANRIYQSSREQERDLAVGLLLDVSLSTDGWVDERRVLDVEKEAVAVLGEGLAACGDDFGIFTFTSRRRSYVRVETVKEFDEVMGPTVQQRIGALKPGYYTRIGAALRHISRRLEERPNRHRLILLLTDGKPNDLDHYEGRYGVEDTRRAVIEARRKGLAVFGITIDAEARDYFPYLFGPGGYAIVPKISKLSQALPAIYRQLIR